MEQRCGPRIASVALVRPAHRHARRRTARTAAGCLEWQKRFVQVQRNLVRGVSTTPRNHQRRRVHLSHHLIAALRLWRSAASCRLARGRPSVSRMDVFRLSRARPLDECRTCRTCSTGSSSAGVHRRGPRRMRHTFASLLFPRIGDRSAMAVCRANLYFRGVTGPESSNFEALNRITDATRLTVFVDDFGGLA